MVLYIKDPVYRNKVTRFINQNYDTYGFVKLVASAERIKPLDHTVLTDDLDYRTDELAVYYLTKQRHYDAHHINMYQRFDFILDFFKEKMPDVPKTCLRIIHVTSLVGGTGKTFFSKQIANLLACAQSTIYLSLYDLTTESNLPALSTVVFRLMHGSAEEAAQSYYQQIDKVMMMRGFQHMTDIVSQEIDHYFEALAADLTRRGVSNLVIDSLPVSYVMPLYQMADCNIVIRDSTRQTEESLIQGKLAVATAQTIQIINNSVAPLAGHFPRNINQQTSDQLCINKLKDVLKAGGILAN